jgi:DNA polymerase
LNTASEERWACQQCGLFKKCPTPFTKPEVSEGWTGKVLVVGEGATEHGRVFDRAAHKLLTRIWQNAGYGDADIAMVSAIRCSPGAKTTPSMKQIRACRPYLLRVIAALKPKYVLAMGATALRALKNDGVTNITRGRGKDFGGELNV